ncbi:MAG: adenylate kinase [Actinomycetota bacterium]|nr:adenylate kinase [Actinomycetota bacterium]
MERVVIVGCPGSGKTTLAAAIAEHIGGDHIELGALFHGPEWTPTPAEEFRAALKARIQGSDRWVTCGNYVDVSDGLHLAAADTVVWLDLSRPLVTKRVMRRTVGRAVRREELWNGNHEPLSNFWAWNPERNIIRWTWVQHPVYRATFERSMTDGTWAHTTVHRLRAPTEVLDFRQRWVS